MVFVTKNPSHYFAPLSEKDTTEPLHIGLYLAGSVSDAKRNDFISLGKAIRASSRPIRCLWLRFKDTGDDDSLLSAFRAFGDELTTATTNNDGGSGAGSSASTSTSITSLVFEGRVTTNVVSCLRNFLMSPTCDIRGIQFRRTDVDVTTFTLLRPFFAKSNTLTVIDMSQNPNVGDECIHMILDGLSEGETMLETLNIGENNLDLDVIIADDEEENGDGSQRISGDCVASIASYISNSEYLPRCDVLTPACLSMNTLSFSYFSHTLACIPPLYDISYITLAPSLSSVTLRLRHLDDIGIGEIANNIKRSDCKLRRLDVSGNYGNSGIKIFAEALKTNVSLRTITFGCLKTLDDAGAQVLLDVVDPFSNETTTSALSKSSEWENIKRSNHTLQSIFILDRPTMTANKTLLDKLQSISTKDPHRTFQNKCWHHIEKNIEDVSHMKVEHEHMPLVLSFVQQHGTMDDMFRMIKNSPDLVTNPSPEKARLSKQMSKVESENEILKELLEKERVKAESLREQNISLRSTLIGSNVTGEDVKKGCQGCCPLGQKICEIWMLLCQLLREID